MSCQRHEIENIKAKIKLRDEWLDDNTIDSCYDYAMSDYLALKYPIEETRPTPETLKLEYSITSWIEKRMIDILSRAGLSLSSYKENNLNLTYGASYIDPYLASMFKPKASVPQWEMGKKFIIVHD